MKHKGEKVLRVKIINRGKVIGYLHLPDGRLIREGSLPKLKKGG